jgi:hypothetical protein
MNAKNLTYLGFEGLGSGRVGAWLLLGLVAVIVLLTNVGQVWALTITPNPPIAGEPFTITSMPGYSSVFVFSSSDCSGGVIASSFTSPFTLTLSAGQYSAYSGDVSGCVKFTVVPAAIPEYPYGLGVLAVFMVVGYGLIKRRSRSA